MNLLGWSFWRFPRDGWCARLLGFQLAWYPRGRRPLFSERNGRRKPPPTLHVGRGELTIAKLRRLL